MTNLAIRLWCILDFLHRTTYSQLRHSHHDDTSQSSCSTGPSDSFEDQPWSSFSSRGVPTCQSDFRFTSSCHTWLCSFGLGLSPMFLREAEDVSRCIGQKLTFLMRNISAYYLRFLWIPTVRLLPVVTEHNKGFLKYGGGVRRMCCPCG